MTDPTDTRRGYANAARLEARRGNEVFAALFAHLAEPDHALPEDEYERALVAQYGQESLDAYRHYCEAEDRDHEEELAAGGLKICPRCTNRTLRVTYRYTRNYGGGQDSFAKCETDGCGYADVST